MIGINPHLSSAINDSLLSPLNIFPLFLKGGVIRTVLVFDSINKRINKNTRIIKINSEVNIYTFVQIELNINVTLKV